MVRNPPANAGDMGSIPGSGRYLGEGNSNPLPVFLPGKSHGQRSPEGYSPWGCKLVGHNLATRQQLASYFIPGSVLCQCYCLNSCPAPPLAVSTSAFSNLPLCSCSAGRLIGIFPAPRPGSSSWDLAEGFWLIKGKGGSPRGAGTQPAYPCTRLRPKQDRT